MLTIDKIYNASNVLKEIARHTDMIQAPRLSDKCDLYLKTENLQLTGSFKLRGAYYKISQLSEEEKSHGVIACSAGNHAQGVALAATHSGIKSVICLPEGAHLFRDRAGKICTYKEWEGLDHETMNEDVWKDVVDGVIGWLDGMVK